MQGGHYLEKKTLIEKKAAPFEAARGGSLYLTDRLTDMAIQSLLDIIL